MVRGEPLSPALREACNNNDIAAVQALTKDLANKRWSAILEAACDGGSVELASYCIEQGATIDYEVRYAFAWNAKSEPVYRHFVETGVTDVTFENVFIDRAGDILGLAADDGRHELVRFMLERGATPNTALEYRCSRPTIVCAAMNSDAEMVELLLDYGAKFHGYGILAAAAGKGKVDTVDLLLSRGAGVNEKEVRMCRDGWSRPTTDTALHRAAKHGHGEVIERLLQAGADIRIRNQDGETAGDVADQCLDVHVLARLKVE